MFRQKMLHEGEDVLLPVSQRREAEANSIDSKIQFRPKPPQCDFFLKAAQRRDRKSTRLNSSHGYISYAVFCLKKKKSTLERQALCRHDSATLIVYMHESSCKRPRHMY